MNSIVQFESENIKVVPYGLQFQNSVSRKEWNSALLAVQQIDSMVQWYLGDLMIQADIQWQGEMYEIMMRSTGYDYGTLRNLYWVASAYTHDVREYVYEKVMSSRDDITKLSFGHFRMVAPLMKNHKEKGIHILIKAGKEGWSVARLVEELSGSKEIIETTPASIGYSSWMEWDKKYSKEYTPLRSDVEYDELAYLLEKRDYLDAKIREEYAVVV